MNVPSVKFNVSDQPEFIKELRRKVNQHFKDNNLSRYGNLNMKVKTVFMLTLYFVPLGLMLTGVASTFLTTICMWFLMGFGMAGIGTSVIHDANHGSYSKNKRVNKFLGYLLNIIGAYHVNWKIQHNVLHHSFTNVHEFDEDINTPVMRFSPNQKRRKIFRFQAFYAPFFYGIMTIYWLVSKDFEGLVKYRKKNLLQGQGLTFGKAMTELILTKSFYVAVLIVIPMIMIDLPWWQTLLGFLLMQGICGLLLSLIFQPAHVLEETAFFKTCDHGSVENNWAIHQLKTTANFADKSRLFSWFIGGLNYQIEHHLFPNICHVHYKRISKIVRETAEEFNVPYYQHKTFFSAVRSHFTLLNQLGTGKYDRKLAGIN